MKITETEILTLKEKNEVYDLWNSEYPKNLMYNNPSEFERYLFELSDQYHILVKNDSGIVKGWYFDFNRDDERWFATIIQSELQSCGYGTTLLSLAKRKRDALNGWVIHVGTYKKANGELYRSPIDFYRKNDFLVLNETELKTDRFSAIKIIWTNSLGSTPSFEKSH